MLIILHSSDFGTLPKVCQNHWSVLAKAYLQTIYVFFRKKMYI